MPEKESVIKVIKFRVILFFLRILETLRKLLGAVDPNIAQVSKQDLVVTYGDSEDGDGMDLKILVPYYMMVEDSEYVERVTTLIAWALTAPDHYWKSSALGVDVLDEAYRKVGAKTKMPARKNQD